MVLNGPLTFFKSPTAMFSSTCLGRESVSSHHLSPDQHHIMADNTVSKGKESAPLGVPEADSSADAPPQSTSEGVLPAEHWTVSDMRRG